MRYFCALGIFMALFPAHVNAQSPGVGPQSQLDVAFAYVDLNQVPTGRFPERNYKPSLMRLSTGAAADSFAGRYPDIALMYCALAASAVNAQAVPMPTWAVAQARVIANRHQSTASVMLLDYGYAEYEPFAIQNGQFTWDGAHLSDVPGRAQSPYIPRRVFAAATIDEFLPQSAQFIFRDDLYFRDMPNPPATLEVDFDDGQGYQFVTWNVPRAVRFPTSGMKVARIRATYTDGSVRATRFMIGVKPDVVAPTAQPGFALPYSFEADQPYRGYKGAGKLFVRYGCGNGGQLRKPFVIVQGFEIVKETKPRYDYAALSIDMKLSKDLEENIIAAGYDIVFLQLSDPLTYIERNAFVLEAALAYVRQQQTLAGSTEQISVMGISMGGLIARWCLKDMEERGVPHNVGLYLSWDSPHQGANVPIGLQWMLRRVQADDYLNKEVFADDAEMQVKLAEGVAALRSPAAMEMLRPYALWESELASEEVQHNRGFYARLGAKGFPAQCRNVAMSNGSQIGVGLPFPAGDLILRAEGNTGDLIAMIYQSMTKSNQVVPWVSSPLLLIAMVYGQFDGLFEFKVWSVKPNAGEDDPAYRGRIELNWPRFSPIKLIRFRPVDHNHPAYLHRPIDASPGGTFSIADFGGDILNGGSLPIRVLQPVFDFIPIASALDLAPQFEQDPYANVELQRVARRSRTPFLDYSAPALDVQGSEYNERHTRFTAKNGLFLLGHLVNEAAAPRVPAGTDPILCVTSGTTSRTFSVTPSPDFTLTWSATGPVTPASGTGASFTVTALNQPWLGPWAEVTLRASRTTPGCEVLLPPQKLRLWVGAPPALPITGNSATQEELGVLCSRDKVMMRVDPPLDYPAWDAVQYDWKVNNGPWVRSLYPVKPFFTSNQNGSAIIYARGVDNSNCGLGLESSFWMTIEDCEGGQPYALQVSPNPASSRLTYRLVAPAPAPVPRQTGGATLMAATEGAALTPSPPDAPSPALPYTLLDREGQACRQGTMQGAEGVIDLQGLAPGAYTLLVVHPAKGPLHTKFIVIP
jgi:hypothetical protein